MIGRGVEHLSAETKKTTTFLPFALPEIDATEFEEVKESLESGWITTGPKVKQTLQRKSGRNTPLLSTPVLRQCTLLLRQSACSAATR